jgi:hypothetical protein
MNKKTRTETVLVVRQYDGKNRLLDKPAAWGQCMFLGQTFDSTQILSLRTISFDDFPIK